MYDCEYTFLCEDGSIEDKLQAAMTDDIYENPFYEDFLSIHEGPHKDYDQGARERKVAAIRAARK